MRAINSKGIFFLVVTIFHLYPNQLTAQTPQNSNSFQRSANSIIGQQLSTNKKTDKASTGKDLINIDKSGDAHANIPITQIKGRKLTLPINLNYKAGIKADQKSSDVGLGWNISFGSIKRDYGAFEPDYASKIDEKDFPNKLIYKEYTGNPNNPTSIESYSFDNIWKSYNYSGLSSGNTRDNYIVSVPGLGNNVFFDQRTGTNDFSFILKDYLPWIIKPYVKKYTQSQEYSRINEITTAISGNAISNTNSSGHLANLAAAICVPSYVPIDNTYQQNINNPNTLNTAGFYRTINTTPNNTTGEIGSSIPLSNLISNTNGVSEVNYDDFEKFIITTDDGTQYIFGLPLRGQKYLFTEDPYWSTLKKSAKDSLMSTNTNHYSGFVQKYKIFGEFWKIDFIAEWLLTEVRSSDFVDNNNNQIADDGDSGDWIRIEYDGGFNPSDANTYINETVPGLGINVKVPKYREWLSYSRTDKQSSLWREVAYVKKIITPVQELNITSEGKGCDVNNDYFTAPANKVEINGSYQNLYHAASSSTSILNISYPCDLKKYTIFELKDRSSNLKINTYRLNYANKGSTNELAVSRKLIRNNANNEDILYNGQPHTPSPDFINLASSNFDYTQDGGNGRGKLTLIGIDIFPGNTSNLNTIYKESYKFEYGFNPDFDEIHDYTIYKLNRNPSVRESYSNPQGGSRSFCALDKLSTAPYSIFPKTQSSTISGPEFDEILVQNYQSGWFDRVLNYCKTDVMGYYYDHSKTGTPSGPGTEYTNGREAWSLSKIILPENGYITLTYERDENEFTDDCTSWSTIAPSETQSSNIHFKNLSEFKMPFQNSDGGIRLRYKKHYNGIDPNPIYTYEYLYGKGHFTYFPVSYLNNYIGAYSSFLSNIRNFALQSSDPANAYFFFKSEYFNKLRGPYSPKNTNPASGSSYTFGPTPNISGTINYTQCLGHFNGLSLNIRMDNLQDDHFYEYISESGPEGRTVTTYGYYTNSNAYSYDAVSKVLPLNTASGINKGRKVIKRILLKEGDKYNMAEALIVDEDPLKEIRPLIIQKSVGYSGIYHSGTNLFPEEVEYTHSFKMKSSVSSGSGAPVSQVTHIGYTSPVDIDNQYYTNIYGMGVIDRSYSILSRVTNVLTRVNYADPTTGNYNGNNINNVQYAYNTDGLLKVISEVIPSSNNRKNTLIRYCFEEDDQQSNSVYAKFLLNNKNMKSYKSGEYVYNHQNGINSLLSISGDYFSAVGNIPTTNIMQAKVNTWQLPTSNTAPNHPFPHKSLIFRSAIDNSNYQAIIPQGIFTPYNFINPSSSNIKWIEKNEILEYNKFGLPKLAKEGSIYSRSVYGYNAQSTIANFRNSISAFDATYTGFEDHTLSIGNDEQWTGGNGALTIESRTGRFGYNLDQFENTPIRNINIPATYPSNAIYKLIFWAKTKPTQLTNCQIRLVEKDATNTIISNTIVSVVTNLQTQWTKNEITLALNNSFGTASSFYISIENNGSIPINIDDILIVPENSHYNYLTKDQFDNVTSQTDMNDNTTKVIYDNWGRISSNYDPDGNQLQSYTYYRSKTLDKFPHYNKVLNYIDHSNVSHNMEKFDGLGRVLQTETGEPHKNRRTINVVEYNDLGKIYKTYNTYGESGFYPSVYLDNTIPGKLQTLYNNTRPFIETTYHHFYYGKSYETKPQGTATPSIVHDYTASSNNFSIAAFNTSNVIDLDFTSEKYHIEKITGEGVTSLYKDIKGKTFLKIDPIGYSYTFNSDGSINWDYNSTYQYAYTYFKYDAAGNLVKTKSPNGLITTNIYSSIGELLEEETPDKGTVRYRYDKLGRLRFIRTAEDLSSNTHYLLTYYKYDSYGRQTEAGKIKLPVFGNTDPFDDENLINDMAYPTLSVQVVEIHSKKFYDGSKQNNAANMLIKDEVYSNHQNGTPDLDIYEYTYTKAGKLKSKSYTLSGLSGTHRIEIQYNRAGLVTLKTYLNPNTSGPNNYDFIEAFEYDDLGRMVKVKTGQTLTSLVTDATYTYDALGKLHIKTIGEKTIPDPNDPGIDYITYKYDIRNQLIKQFSRKFKYALQYDAYGRITHQIWKNNQFDVNSSPEPLPGQTFSENQYEYYYDPLSRLVGANYLQFQFTNDVNTAIGNYSPNQSHFSSFNCVSYPCSQLTDAFKMQTRVLNQGTVAIGDQALHIIGESWEIDPANENNQSITKYINQQILSTTASVYDDETDLIIGTNSQIDQVINDMTALKDAGMVDLDNYNLLSNNVLAIINQAMPDMNSFVNDVIIAAGSTPFNQIPTQNMYMRNYGEDLRLKIIQVASGNGTPLEKYDLLGDLLTTSTLHHTYSTELYAHLSEYIYCLSCTLNTNGLSNNAPPTNMIGNIAVLSGRKYDTEYYYDKAGNFNTHNWYDDQQLLTNMQYTIPANSNKLSTLTIQFNNNPSTTHNYTYTPNGDLNADGRTLYTFHYNSVSNLPYKQSKNTDFYEYRYENGVTRSFKLSNVNNTITKEYYIGDVVLNDAGLPIRFAFSGGFVEFNPITNQSNKFYAINDWQGTVRMVIDANDQITNTRDHYPYGRIMPMRLYETGIEGKRRQYTGHELDETQYEYHGARYYDRELGVYTSTEPLHFKYPNETPYIYCGDNPISYNDPNGLDRILTTTYYFYDENGKLDEQLTLQSTEIISNTIYYRLKSADNWLGPINTHSEYYYYEWYHLIETKEKHFYANKIVTKTSSKYVSTGITTSFKSSVYAKTIGFLTPSSGIHLISEDGESLLGEGRRDDKAKMLQIDALMNRLKGSGSGLNSIVGKGKMFENNLELLRYALESLQEGNDILEKIINMELFDPDQLIKCNCGDTIRAKDFKFPHSFNQLVPTN